jgi:hypothetical protein
MAQPDDSLRVPLSLSVPAAQVTVVDSAGVPGNGDSAAGQGAADGLAADAGAGPEEAM